MNASLQDYENELSLAELEEQLSRTTNNVIVVLFTVPWSGNGSMMQMVLNQLLENNGEKVEYYTINVDNHPEALEEFGLMDVPTITLYYKKELVGLFNKLVSQHILQQHINQFFDEV